MHGQVQKQIKAQKSNLVAYAVKKTHLAGDFILDK
jgi:hypothetical protein